MKKLLPAMLVAFTFGVLGGCGSSVYRGKLAPFAPDTGHHDIWDATFRRRHVDLKAPIQGDPMLELARDITMLEDDIRRDGSIAIKAPDVWGDGDLIAAIQEYDRFMGFDGKKEEFEKRFTETVQAYIARSDFAEFQSATAIGSALGGAKVANLPGNTIKPADDKGSTVNILSANLAEPTKESETFAANSFARGFVTQEKSATIKPIALEPTVLDRQRSTYVLANQGLRRRMLGDDNSRAAGYGLYLFRIPVSILPGRETTEGYSAVASLRAQMQVDANHLKNALPRMVIADVVEGLVPRILAEWEQTKQKYDEIQELKATHEEARKAEVDDRGLQNYINDYKKHEQSARTGTDGGAGLPRKSGNSIQKNMANRSMVDVSITNIQYNDQKEVYSEGLIEFIEYQVAEHFAEQSTSFVLPSPKPEEVRQFLYSLFEQTHNVLEENHLYECMEPTIERAGEFVVKGNYPKLNDVRCEWYAGIDEQFPEGECGLDKKYRYAGWFLALQMGINDRNLRKLLRDLSRKGSVPVEQCGAIDNVRFYLPNSPDAALLWETIIRESFPLHVFNLDPVTEEQNAYDAFSRRREMQVALAFSVAKGNVFTADQKMRMSRELALDEATIALNRTAVAFAHGEDTFGWYFHPRIQTPPTESSNLGALARTIWSTGPTDRYDRRHRRLEPGIRECEVLISMPTFVSEISFDVTTNWEKIAKPGVTKRSYEEMLAQGSRLHRLRMCMKEPNNQQCYRPGDVARLSSRIDQLETMLGMQTYNVNLPFQNDQRGTELFNAGTKQLRPSIEYYYGLRFLGTGENKCAEFFITGRNFHPTLTHVVVGGVEVHSGDGFHVEVINRELIRVTVGYINPLFSEGKSIEVRVATPTGMSNLLVMEAAESTEKDAQAPTYDWKKPYEFEGYFDCSGDSRKLISEPLCNETLKMNAVPSFAIPSHGKMSLDVVFNSKSGETYKLEPCVGVEYSEFQVHGESLLNLLNAYSILGMPSTYDLEGTITCTAYIEGPVPVRLPKPIVIKIKKAQCPDNECSTVDPCTKGCKGQCRCSIKSSESVKSVKVKMIELPAPKVQDH